LGAACETESAKREKRITMKGAGNWVLRKGGRDSLGGKTVSGKGEESDRALKRTNAHGPLSLPPAAGERADSKREMPLTTGNAERTIQ